jgi:hypothetical protein
MLIQIIRSAFRVLISRLFQRYYFEVPCPTSSVGNVPKAGQFWGFISILACSQILPRPYNVSAVRPSNFMEHNLRNAGWISMKFGTEGATSSVHSHCNSCAVAGNEGFYFLWRNSPLSGLGLPIGFRNLFRHTR